MTPKIRSVNPQRRNVALLGTLVAMLFMLPAQAHPGPGHAHQDSSNVKGTWHVAVPGWGIEDHLLVLQERAGTLIGKFEFADVKGTIGGARLQFDVTNGEGKLILHFVGTISDRVIKGEVTSPQDGPLLQHGAGSQRTTGWIAKRKE